MSRGRLLAVAVVAGGWFVAGAPPAAAHGLGGRSDLPLPLWMFAYGAAAALLISFAGLAVFWRTARLEDGVRSAVLLDTRAGVGRALALVGRAMGLGLFAVVLGAASFGDPAVSDNIAPVFVYVTFWVGMTLLSALVGDVWRWLNPFDTLAAAVERLRGRGAGARPGAVLEQDDDRGDGESEPAPWHATFWPAAVGLLAFTWLELVYPDRAQPRVLAVAIASYTVVVLVAVARWGRPWLARGEAFTAFFGLLAQMAPFYVADGRLRVRPPLAGLAGLEARPGMQGVVLVALGSTTYDGITRTRLWADLTGDMSQSTLTLVGTLGLVWAVGMVAVAYAGAMRVTARLFGGDSARLASAFAHSLVPIAFAYAVAHYFSLLLFEGQGALALASDPFGRGWDLFGTAGRMIDFTLVSPTTVAYIQAGGIVVGHVAGVVVAHDRALALFPGHHAARSQYPLLVAMVVFTITGLALLLGS